MRGVGTTSYSQIYRPELITTTIGCHQVIHGAIEDVRLTSEIDIAITDPPAIDETWVCQQYEEWFNDKVMSVVNRACKPDAVFILIPRDRKGGAWLKSIATASVIQRRGWDLFRQFVWLRQEADFSRARYAYGLIFAFRRGNRSTNPSSPLRYRDIIRLRDTPKEGLVGEFPTEIVRLMLSLFLKPSDVVLDPFAGTGSVAAVCQELGVRSISVELDPGKVAAIIKRLGGK